MIILLTSFVVSAQSKTTLLVYNESENLIQKIKTDSSKVQRLVEERVLKLQSDGYVTSYIDTFYCGNDTCIADIFIGEKYFIKTLKITSQQTSILESRGIKTKHLTDKSPDSTYLHNVLKSLVQHRNNNGYPFATSHLEIIDIEGSDIHAKINLIDGKQIWFDTIMTEGRLVMPQKFFGRVLEIRKGEPYDHDKVLKSSKRLRDLQYLTLRGEPSVRFVNDRAHLYFMPDPRPASRFDFLIGVLPQVEDGVRKFTFAVDFTAEMYNSFRRGEYSLIQVKRLMPENLELVMKSTVPYIGGLPVGSHIDFRLFKNADVNLDLFFDGGAQWLFRGFNQLKLFASYRSSSLIEVDVENIQASGRLPSRLDVSYSGAGLNLNLMDVDYRFNPTKGYVFNINTVLGNKKINPNISITQIPGLENSYDSLRLSTFQIEADISAEYYLPIGNWATVKMGILGGIRFNQERILENELMRIGGNKILRGFDEESLLTDFYSYSTLEFRIVFDQNSYFTLPFMDWGYVRIEEKLTPVIGLGMGFNIGTKAGIFNVAFAAGRAVPNPLDFGRMKVHFGYVNLF